MLLRKHVILETRSTWLSHANQHKIYTDAQWLSYMSFELFTILPGRNVTRTIHYIALYGENITRGKSLNRNDYVFIRRFDNIRTQNTCGFLSVVFVKMCSKKLLLTGIQTYAIYCILIHNIIIFTRWLCTNSSDWFFIRIADFLCRPM